MDPHERKVKAIYDTLRAKNWKAKTTLKNEADTSVFDSGSHKVSERGVTEIQNQCCHFFFQGSCA